MRVHYLVAAISLIWLKIVGAQDFQEDPSSNNTILQILSNTSNSPALKFVEFLHSSPEYQPIIDILSDPSSNVTLFVPSDQVYFDATGEQPPTTSTCGFPKSSQPINGTTQTAIGATATTASSSTQIGSFLSSILSSLSAVAASSTGAQQPTISSQPTPIRETFAYVQIAPRPTAASNMAKYVKIPNAEIVQPYEHFVEDNSEAYGGLIMRALHGVQGKSQIHNYVASGWNEVTTNAPFADQFSYTDILNYHLVNGSVQLENDTIILNTFLTNSTVNKFGSGSPIRIQKQQYGQQQSNQPQQSDQSSQTQQPSQTGLPDGQTELPGFTKVPEQTIEPIETPESQQPQWLLQEQEGGESAESNNNVTWTIGTGVGNDAEIMMNQTIQASNGIIYIIDKILIPPVNLTNTIQTIDNATYFEWIFSKSSSISTLYEATNITMFVPTNGALRNINFTDLNSYNIDSAIQAHVIPGVYYSTNLTSEPTSATSVAGTDIVLTNSDPMSNDSVTVNDIKVVQVNILLNNGVMHLIDGILNYPTVEPPESDPDQTQSNVGPFPPPANQSSAMRYTDSKAFIFFIPLVFGLLCFT